MEGGNRRSNSYQKIKGMDKMKTAKPDSVVASKPCPSDHITADKRLHYASHKSLQIVTYFIRKMLYIIL